MATFNVQNEVETILKRKLTRDEVRTFKQLRHIGYANPYDIIAKLEA